MKKVKDSKAITLIALIITIIVLLILAGVTISTLSGENGLLGRAKTAKETYTREQAIEILKTKIMEVRVKVYQEEQRDANLNDFKNVVADDEEIELLELVSSPTASLKGTIEDIEIKENSYAVVKVKSYEFKIDVNLEIIDEIANEDSQVQKSEALVPNMTGYNTPSGTVNASYSNAQYVAWGAFSDEIDWSAWPNGAGSWITYKFDQKVRINKIDIQAYNQYSVVENFTIYGSNNGTDYTVIYTGVHTNTSDLETFNLQDYSERYQYIKLNVDSVYNNAAVAIKTIQYYGYKVEE